MQRYAPGGNIDAQGQSRGIVARLERAIVVGPIARLELIPAESNQAGNDNGGDPLIEAQISAQQFREMNLQEGEVLVVTPRRARIFVDEGALI